MSPSCSRAWTSAGDPAPALPPAPVGDRRGMRVLSHFGFDQICFRTDSIEATLERFAAIGVTPRNEVMDFHDRKLVFLNGPDGVVIELAEWTITPPLPRRQA